jgi:large subunit ribosomal protein L30
MTTISKVSVKLIKSLIGRTESQKASVRGLGLKKIGQTVIVEDTPCNRGMINKVPFLLCVKESSNET